MLFEDAAPELSAGEVAWKVPYARRPWDEVMDGLWVGCHQYDNEDGTPAKAIVTNQFDLVVSLWCWPGHGPDEGVEHARFQFEDTVIDAQTLSTLEDLAEYIDAALVEGKQVLIRCRAGLNRSALLAGMVMKRRHYGSSVIEDIRAFRSPYALSNRYFEWYLRTGDVNAP